METEKIEVIKSTIPKGTKLVEAYETHSAVVVMYGRGEPISDEHNCDEMGCGSLSHVKYILSKP